MREIRGGGGVEKWRRARYGRAVVVMAKLRSHRLDGGSARLDGGSARSDERANARVVEGNNGREERRRRTPTGERDKETNKVDELAGL